MSAQASTPPAAAAAPPSDLTAKINELQNQISTIENEIKMISGRISNRDPVKAKQITQENSELKKKLEVLEKISYSLMLATTQPTKADEAGNSYEVIRQAAVEYFKQINLDIETWKNIAS